MKNLELIDPTTLTVDSNVRKAADLGTNFVESIKEHGVLQPVTAHRTENGLHVLMGQRRTLASIEAGLDSIPVYVVDSPEEADRIAQQVIENDMRTELTVVDRAEAFHQLSLIGMAPSKIAKRTGSTKEKVADALTAKRSVSGQTALGYGVPFDMAAQITEFEAHPDLAEDLSAKALNEPEYFEHAIERARREMSGRVAVAEKKAELNAEGKTVVEEGMPWQNLVNPDGNPATESDATAYKVTVSHYNTSAQVSAVIEDWEEKGFTRHVYYGTQPSAGPRTEEQKKERKELIERNKEMDAATTVRQNWIVSLLQRKELPTGHTQFSATTLCIHRYEVTKADVALVARILGVTDTSGSYKGIQPEASKNAKRAQQVMLATSLATYEKMIVRDCWRNTSGQEADMRAEYLTQLVAWGYKLSDVEKITARITD